MKGNHVFSTNTGLEMNKVLGEGKRMCSPAVVTAQSRIIHWAKDDSEAALPGSVCLAGIGAGGIESFGGGGREEFPNIWHRFGDQGLEFQCIRRCCCGRGIRERCHALL